jgi:glutamine cyclotransferase
MRTSAAIGLLLLAMTVHRSVGFAGGQHSGAAAPARFGYSIVRTYPHDPRAFTQGLQYHDGFLYEGTGQHGQSSIRKVRLDTGEVLQRRALPDQFFGEGIAVWNTQLFQLTWQSGVAFVYDLQTFAPVRQFSYAGEGWGLTDDGALLIMSDGTEFLRFIDPATFKETGRIRVTASGEPVTNLNELEYVKGEVLANVWQTDLVARIDPASGRVTGWIDLTGLLSPRERASTDVLNGIAYDEAGGRLFVTGKWWPRVFEITVTSR